MNMLGHSRGLDSIQVTFNHFTTIIYQETIFFKIAHQSCQPPPRRNHRRQVGQGMLPRCTYRQRRSLHALSAKISTLLIALVSGLILLAGCGQATTTQDTPAVSPPDPRVAVSSWWTGGGQDRLSAISTDFARLASTSAAADITGLRAACTSLQTHVESAQAYTIIPDTLAQADWSTALAQGARTATDCIAFTHNLDGDLLAQSGRELSGCDTAILKLTDRITALNTLQG
ncbi:MAG TPA: hypothetical protein VGL46_21340 [Pseudonocardiaceae bacterium]|jgi:hypothetical protein